MTPRLEGLVAVGRREPLRTQAAYYFATGIWPIVHLRSFMALTGRKTDTWLVQTFGALIAAIGIAIWPRAAADADGATRAQENVAVGTAVALAASDAFFVARRRIRFIYLGDAAVELALAAAILARRGQRTSRTR